MVEFLILVLGSNSGKNLRYNPGLENQFYKRVFGVNRGFY